MNNTTELLYAAPSFLEGAGSVMDLGYMPTEYNTSDTEEDADGIALMGDWYVIGNDLRDTISTFFARYFDPNG